MSSCNIISLPPDLFANLTSLRIIDLSGNQLTHEVMHALDSLGTQLDNLNLAQNNMEKLPVDCFAGWRIQKLDIGQLQPFASLQGCFKDANITELSLKNSNLPYGELLVVRAVNGSLETLDISGNAVDFTGPELFDNLRNLKELFLRNTRLQSFPVTLPSSFRGLKTLDVGKNNITKIGLSQLKQMPNLKSFQIDQNLMDKIDEEVLKYLEGMTEVTIHGNPLECGCETKKIFNFLSKRNKTAGRNEVASIKRATCASPAKMAGKVIIRIPVTLLPTCSRLFGVSGLTDDAELLILIAASIICALLVAIAVGIAHSKTCIEVMRGQNPEDVQDEEPTELSPLRADMEDRDGVEVGDPRVQET